MAILNPKSRILREAGYAYNFDRMIYFNRKAKKIFSVEFIEDHKEDEILSCLKENGGRGSWRFYFNSPPPEAVQRELVSVLE